MESAVSPELLIANRAAVVSASIAADVTPACRRRFPPGDYVRAAAGVDAYRYCEDLPPAQVRLADRIVLAFPDDFHRYQRLTLATLIGERLQTGSFAALPGSLRHRSLDWFRRILDLAESGSANQLDWRGLGNIERSDLLKDFAVAAGRALPLSGAWIAERRRMLDTELFAPRNGTPAPPFAAAGRRFSRLLPAANRLRRAWREWRGRYGDFLVIHTAYRYRRQFTAGHMANAYSELAELLRRDPTLVGIYRRSWFLDPALAEHEPRLAFLRSIPQSHGAELCCLGHVDPEKRPEILGFSRARRQAYESGRYAPSEWAYLWRREDVERWSIATDKSAGG